jgi:uncharacterized protein (DUF433 family)
MLTSIAEHIDVQPGRCGGKPCVAGTRIRVWDVHVWHDLRGWSPAEIVTQFPPLTLADVHAALAYYHDHREEIDQQMREAEEVVEQMKAQAGPSRLDQMRERDASDADVSSG